MDAAALLAEVQLALGGRFGSDHARATVTFLGVEPISVLRFRGDDASRTVSYVSLGMSGRPMSDASLTVADPDGPRAELLLVVRDPGDRFVDVWRQLAVLAAAPAVEGVVYSEGMTVDLGAPLAAGSRCTGVVVGPGSVLDGTSEPVTLLPVLGATAGELAWSRVHGTNALLERWSAAETDLPDLARTGVELGG